VLTSRWRLAAATVTVVLATLPVAVVLVLYAGRDFVPGGDLAIVDARVRDVFTHHVPLVGSYSRGFNHPGPLMFYLLGPLNGIAVSAPWSTLVAGVLLQVVALSFSAWVAWRRGGLTLTVLVLAAMTLAYGAVGPRVFLDYWNPFIALPFFPLFILEVWSVTVGDRWHLVGVGAVGSFLVQTHVGYVTLVAAGAVWALALAVFDARRDPTAWRGWRGPAAAAAALVVALWIPPIVDELTNHPGNITLLVRYLRHHAVGTGLRNGAGLFAAEFRVLPPWLGGPELLHPLRRTATAASLWWLVIPTVVLLSGFVAARRSGAAGSMRLIALVAVLVIVGIVTLGRVDPPLDTYLFEWRIVLAIFVFVAAGWALVNVPELRDAIGLRMIAALCVLSLLAWAAAVLTVDLARRPRVNRYQPDAVVLLRQLHHAGIPSRPFIAQRVGTAYLGMHAAIVDQLDAEGRPVRVDPPAASAWGRHRSLPPDQAQVIWYVIEEGRHVSLLTAVPGARVVARTTPLSAAQEAELVALQRSLTLALHRAGRSDLNPFLEYSVLVPLLVGVPGVDREQVTRVRELEDRVNRSGRCRCAVIAFAPRHAPSPPPD
jgi:hypothetical protein